MIFFKKNWELFITIWIIIIALIIIYSYFLSLNKNSRDANRYSDILSINNELKKYYTKNNIYPLPDEYINITWSGIIINYQWYAWNNFFNTIWIEEIKDPKKNKYFKFLNYYTYTISKDKKIFQLMWFYESYKNKYFPSKKRTIFNYWDKVWIVIEDKTKKPIQESKLWLDILNTDNFYKIYLDDEKILEWNKNILRKLLNYTDYVKTEKTEASSCLEIKNAWWNDTWVYYIKTIYNILNKKESKVYKVFCDMESDWWWRTRLYYKKWKNTCYNFDNNYDIETIKNLFTKDFWVSDSIITIQSQLSWILNNVNFMHKDFDYLNFTNVSNCKTPNWEKWNNDYVWWYLNIQWTLSTFWTWNQMFYGCKSYKNIWDKINFRIWWSINNDWFIHNWEFIHWICNDYSSIDNSITSKWDWDNIRTIWVR